MPLLNEVSGKQEAIRAVIREANESDDKTIIGAVLTSHLTDHSEDILVNTTLAFMQVQLQNEPSQGHIFQALALMDYLDSLGLRITWKNETR